MYLATDPAANDPGDVSISHLTWRAVLCCAVLCSCRDSVRCMPLCHAAMLRQGPGSGQLQIGRGLASWYPPPPRSCCKPRRSTPGFRHAPDTLFLQDRARKLEDTMAKRHDAIA
ncbi:uncharacterized protein UV8b_07020 [Ustilaginoidea virens]|uniref:Uncharacterized protein n=1 Tax=Ustilaginoidea virens TaxID=1159556 RepID=A0A8E5HWB1_USTVR|nr:uncharacterized protein UV8b_07020 [Ustilaginoidea virens]QUC22779.1 hypothetical protein UV8b_07020 [Ustilaginoidea virens]